MIFSDVTETNVDYSDLSETGIICALFTYALLLFAQYVVITVIIIPEENLIYKTFNIIIFELLAFLALSSHLRTMLTDPV